MITKINHKRPSHDFLILIPCFLALIVNSLRSSDIIFFLPIQEGSLPIPLMKRVNESTGYFAPRPALVSLPVRDSALCPPAKSFAVPQRGDRPYYNASECDPLAWSPAANCMKHPSSYWNRFSASRSITSRISACSPFPGFVLGFVPGASSLRSVLRSPLSLRYSRSIILSLFLPSIALSPL
jgi:hypothetical protein